MNHEALFKRAKKAIPGGVNSPVRAFNGVGGTPVFVESGKGARIRTADGRELTDWCCSWGAMILGHAHPEISRAVAARAKLGTTFGIATPDEVTFAERLVSLVPGLDMVRAVSSGTEAVMTAVRLARGVTGRKIILKFDGCYHGHSDAMLVKSGSGVLTMGASSSAGVTRGAVADTLVAPYNDLAAVERAFAKRGEEIAAVIVEPVAGNMGLVPPSEGFLKGLRAVTSKYGALLICDEVINGFRFGFSTYSALYAGVTPDIVTLGKVIGGGLPLAAVGGRRTRDALHAHGRAGQRARGGRLHPRRRTRRARDVPVVQRRVHAVLHGPARAGPRGRESVFDGALRENLPRSAQAGAVRRPLAVRVQLRLGRAHRARRRPFS